VSAYHALVLERSSLAAAREIRTMRRTSNVVKRTVLSVGQLALKRAPCSTEPESLPPANLHLRAVHRAHFRYFARECSTSRTRWRTAMRPILVWYRCGSDRKVRQLGGRFQEDGNRREQGRCHARAHGQTRRIEVLSANLTGILDFATSRGARRANTRRRSSLMVPNRAPVAGVKG
jgi:hypothetical protein